MQSDLSRTWRSAELLILEANPDQTRHPSSLVMGPVGVLRASLDCHSRKWNVLDLERFSRRGLHTAVGIPDRVAKHLCREANITFRISGDGELQSKQEPGGLSLA
ncbi:hypothetical protein RRG08_032732 [Elysia crispata]|uniref:Uncharacterized protein n=1 Tax=Elysia crispata TaxID=231223 RepID=A0AAE0YV36_9GAST|nr:hypothetical protein RRG08_032732 [Elysia crispata]